MDTDLASIGREIMAKYGQRPDQNTRTEHSLSWTRQRHMRSGARAASIRRRIERQAQAAGVVIRWPEPGRG